MKSRAFSAAQFSNCCTGEAPIEPGWRVSQAPRQRQLRQRLAALGSDGVEGVHVP